MEKDEFTIFNLKLILRKIKINIAAEINTKEIPNIQIKNFFLNIIQKNFHYRFYNKYKHYIYVHKYNIKSKENLAIFYYFILIVS